jgi:hypothetical protein
MEFIEWAFYVLVLGALAVGALFGLDALGLLNDPTVAGFVGMGLGVLCLFGAGAAMLRD